MIAIERLAAEGNDDIFFAKSGAIGGTAGRDGVIMLAFAENEPVDLRALWIPALLFALALA